MNTIGEILNKYSDIRVRHKKLLNILDDLDKNSTNIDLSLSINGEVVNLNHLAGNDKKAILEMSKVFGLFIGDISKLEDEMNTIISQLELKGEHKCLCNNHCDSNGEEERDTTSDTASLISKLIDEIEVGEIVNPMEVLQYLETAFGIKEDLSNVNRVLAEKMGEGELKTVYFLKCYKCEGGYETHLDKLPKIITCPDCSQEIINVEIQYKKV